MPDRTDLWMENLLDERDGAALYEGLAALENDPDRAESFRLLAEGERRHADIWRRKLEQEGAALPPDRTSARVRALLWLARRLGTSAVLPLVAENEGNDAEPAAGGRGGVVGARGGGARAPRRAGGHVARPARRGARRHRLARALAPQRVRRLLARRLFGMNDGHVSNLSLVLGVAGAVHEPRTVLVTGLAGLLAGASSMAVGEYTSVASQRDVLARQVAMERREVQSVTFALDRVPAAWRSCLRNGAPTMGGRSSRSRPRILSRPLHSGQASTSIAKTFLVQLRPGHAVGPERRWCRGAFDWRRRRRCSWRGRRGWDEVAKFQCKPTSKPVGGALTPPTKGY
jgi:hypothetical protein